MPPAPNSSSSSDIPVQAAKRRSRRSKKDSSPSPSPPSSPNNEGKAEGKATTKATAKAGSNKETEPEPSQNVAIVVLAAEMKCDVHFVQSLLLSLGYLEKSGIRYSVTFLADDTEGFSQSRRKAVSSFLAEKDFTHLMFLDSDKGFGSETLLELVKSGHPVVGLAPPQKAIKPDLVHKNCKDIDALPNTMTFAKCMTYNVGIAEGKHSIEAGFIKVSWLSGGVVCMSRAAVSDICNAEEVTKRYKEFGSDSYVYGVFDDYHAMDGGENTDGTDGTMYTDTRAMSMRCGKLGIPVHASVTMGVTSVGSFAYQGHWGVALDVVTIEAPTAAGAATGPATGTATGSSGAVNDDGEVNTAPTPPAPAPATAMAKGKGRKKPQLIPVPES